MSTGAKPPIFQCVFYIWDIVHVCWPWNQTEIEILKFLPSGNFFDVYILFRIFINFRAIFDTKNELMILKSLD